MGITKDEAYRVLELPRGASVDEVRSSYKRLALKWHPDKHSNSTQATQKFQEVSSAYKRLTSDDSDDDIILSTADMFDLFAHIFFHRNGMYGCYARHAFESDDDSYFSDDEDEEEMEDELLHNIATRLRNKYDRSKSSTATTPKSGGKPAHNLSEAEAMKNAEELIKQEEKDRKKAEKRRQKKKRNKEKKKQKDKDKKEQNGKENKQDTDKGPSNSLGGEKTCLKDIQNTTNKTAQDGKNTKTTDTSSIAGLKENSSNTNTPVPKKGHSKTKDSKRHQVNGETDSSGDEPDWDTSSAFFARAAGRNPPTNPPTVNGAPQNPSKTTISSPSSIPTDTQTNNKPQVPQPATEQMDPLVLQSRQIAVHGNEMANLGNYQAAIELFTQAVELDARDFRFFGNRSYCFDRLAQYEKALHDADVSISLAPDWPKGYFRRGRALAGLKLFADAESAFAQVLKLDKHCEDAIFELARVRVQQLEEMGFPTNLSEAAIHSYGTVQAALEALLAGKVQCHTSEEIYVSDGEEEQVRTTQRARPVQIINTPCSDSNECKSVWVGNVNGEEVTERHLQQLFLRCGRIETIKILPKRYCAFINYYTVEAAANAIETLQGYEMGGQNLLLRYPNNSGGTPALQPMPKTIDSFGTRPKLSGPVNGDECYFWRTTGCAFADKCRNRHVPENKGCDMRKVEAKYGGKI